MSEAARRKFRREGEERRRQDLIEATLDCVAENGLKGATVRAIALRAGVTAGLIRHYFPGKEELLQAAYSTLMGRMTEQAKAALDMQGADPRRGSRLSSRPTSPRRSWTCGPFRSGPASSAASTAIRRWPAHIATPYLGFRDEVEALVAEVLRDQGRRADKATLQRHAIAINAVIDGLWIEGCLAGDIFASGELAAIGKGSVEALLGLEMQPGDASA